MIDATKEHEAIPDVWDILLGEARGRPLTAHETAIRCDRHPVDVTDAYVVLVRYGLAHRMGHDCWRPSEAALAAYGICARAPEPLWP